jgi:2-polyprenyl-6-methoxyphenol hydroxylase-like FAD-dependent oxidoreductase
MPRVKTALVIGGGVAGPTMASALCKAGIEATIYEAHPAAADGIGGMLMVAPNGLHALDVIDAGEAVRAVGQPIVRMVMEDGAGAQLGEFPGLAGLPPGRAMSRSALYRVLNDHAASQGARIEYAKRLVAVDETPTGVVAHFADGSEAVGDVLIGADGIRSTVRRLIDPNAPSPHLFPLLNFGAIADIAAPGSPDAMYFVFGKRAFMGYWLLPDGRTAWFSNLPHKKPMTFAEAREAPAADWLQRLREVYADDAPGGELVRHTRVEELVAIGSMDILPKVPRWSRGRMVLVGDSAHSPSSSSGQGASLAIESAIELARCLRDLPDAPLAFAAYERLRRSRVEKVAARGAKVNQGKVLGPVAKALMKLAMPLAMRTFLNPEKMLGFEQRYRIDWDQKVAA